MSYLAEIKAQVKEVFDEAFKQAWPVIERAIKDSYHNGLNKGREDSSYKAGPSH